MLAPEPAETTPVATDDADFGPRQADVLEAALALLVEGGDKGFTTARLARAASCSKESLYKWFGDRDGLLAAMVTYQASKVRVAARPSARPGAAEFRRQLTDFARDLLTVLAGPTSLALNRLAIGGAGHSDARLGKLMMERGRRPIEQRAVRLLEAGRGAGLLRYDDREAAFNTFYGLIVGDVHVRMLLGDAPALIAGEDGIRHQAERAIDQFWRLHAAAETSTRDNT